MDQLDDHKRDIAKLRSAIRAKQQELNRLLNKLDAIERGVSQLSSSEVEELEAPDIDRADEPGKKMDDPDAVAMSLCIGEILRIIPTESRLAAIELARSSELEKDSSVRPRLKPMSWDQIVDLDKSPWMRHRGRIMRLAAAIGYTMVRQVTNHHSPEQAARILFSNHGGKGGFRVPGSGFLDEYLDGLNWQKAKTEFIANHTSEDG